MGQPLVYVVVVESFLMLTARSVGASIRSRAFLPDLNCKRTVVSPTVSVSPTAMSTNIATYYAPLRYACLSASVMAAIAASNLRPVSLSRWANLSLPTSASAPIPEGMGTALKPAVEHWILARKPLDGTVGANFEKHGTGVLQIDACRIETSDTWNPARPHANAWLGTFVTKDRVVEQHAAGRWPAHLSLEHAETCCYVGDGKWECVLGCPVRTLDEQSGDRPSGNAVNHAGALGMMNDDGWQPKKRTSPKRQEKPSGASRFFYVAKGSRSEKDAGLAHLAPKSGGEATGREEGSAGTANPRAGAGRTGGARNFHPTVKSVDLMRWLVRLVTPPGGTVLDMFAGSGTTGVAALAEGLSFIAVEQGGDDGEYIPIIEGRLRHALGEKLEHAA